MYVAYQYYYLRVVILGSCLQHDMSVSEYYHLFTHCILNYLNTVCGTNCQHLAFCAFVKSSVDE